MKIPDWRSRFVTEIPVAVALFDQELRYLAASAAWVTAFDLSLAALVGHRHDELRKSGGEALAEVQRRALAGETVERYESDEAVSEDQPWGPLLSARPHRDPDGNIAGVLVALDQMQELAAEEAVRMLPDPLTGLAGRRGFMRRIVEILSEGSSENRAVVVLSVNLDRFRAVNNLHGVDVGDQVLKIIAQRLVSGTRSRRPADEAPALRSRGRDSVARLGADEFGVICEITSGGLPEAEALAERLLQIVQNPIAIGELLIRMTGCLGFVLIGPGHRKEDQVLRDVDLALREAKSRGPNRAVVWEPGLTRLATRRYSIAEQLQRALHDGEFVLHYQPIVGLADNRMVGAEALLRWNHPSDGLMPPDSFISVLEETGLIVPTGAWAVREAARQIESWRELYGRDIIDWVSVNVSARQFNDPALLLGVLNELDRNGFPTRCLRLEITETSLMRNPETARAVISELHALGVSIAIDDFGTGYSCLAALRDYRADSIKIDAGFISQIGSSEGERLAAALLSIARTYGATVIAEGIETSAQRDFLRANGCPLGQGFLFARPMQGAQLGSFALTYSGEGARPQERASETAAGRRPRRPARG